MHTRHELSEIDAACRTLNEANTRTARPGERIADTLMALAAGCLAGWAVVTWATPCEAGALCAATLLPTHHRTNSLRAAWRRLQAWYWRTRLRSIEADIAALDIKELLLAEDLQQLPEQRSLWRLHADAVRTRLVGLDLEGRTQ